MVVRTLVAACLLLFIIAGSSPSSRADLGFIRGVQTGCDAQAGRFQILPRYHNEEAADPILKGFKALPDGLSLVSCKIGKRKLLAGISVIPPQPRGACMGLGAVGVKSLSVDGVELQKEGISFIWDCFDTDDAPVVDVRVEDAGATVSLVICRAEDTRSDKPTCETQSINVDKQAAEFAKIDHDLADPATQAEQSATKIPADNDMAKVFAGQTDPTGAPVCAHWQPQFAWMLDDVPVLARIGGKPQQRAAIHPVYPPLCTLKSDTACDSSAYVIAGDRVEIGFVCGAWTTIRYHPRVRAFPDTVGWVETARIYGIQPLLTPQPVWNPPANDPTWKQPLIAAVLKRDPAAITDLLRNGADPNGEDKSGRPLSVALGSSNLPVVEALLAAGASTEPVASDTNRDRSTPLMQVAMDRAESPKYIVDPERIPNPVALASLLLKHGAKLEATDADGRTALFHAIEANNVDVAAFLIDAGADPNKTWGVRETGAKATDARYVGYTPLMFALTDYWSTRDPSMISLLLERGADPNFMADKEDFDSEDPRFAGVTVLGAAALSGSMTVVRDLLEHGADPSLPRADGALPADIAREAGFPKIAALIAQAAKKKAP